MKQEIQNIRKSWKTSVLGAILGISVMWPALSGFAEAWQNTGLVAAMKTLDWDLILMGSGIMLGGFVMRDGTVSSEDVKTVTRKVKK